MVRAVTPCGSYLGFVVLLFLPPLAFLFASSSVYFQLGIKAVCLHAKPRFNAVKDGIFLGFFFNVVIGVFCGLRVPISIALMDFLHLSLYSFNFNKIFAELRRPVATTFCVQN